MKTALHPTTSQSITVVEYIQLFGPRLDPSGRKSQRPLPRCPACGDGMHTKGEADPGVDGIFSHQPGTTTFCPLKQAAAQPYRVLNPNNPKPNAAVILRKAFFDNWKHHWNLIRSHVPFADINEFIALISYADQAKIWNYMHIKEWELPYIFMALKDFPPIKHRGNSLRKEWIRFWFDSRIRDIDDLWIRTTGDWRIIKAVYASPRGANAIPGPNQLKTTNVITIDPNFLGKPEPIIHQYAIGVMKNAFPDTLK